MHLRLEHSDPSDDLGEWLVSDWAAQSSSHLDQASTCLRPVASMLGQALLEMCHFEAQVVSGSFSHFGPRKSSIRSLIGNNG